jgi:transcription elongation factor Elf1
MRGSTVRLYCQCLNGHKGKRDVGRYQADSMAPDIYKGLFTCVDCGSTMSLVQTNLGRKEVEYLFLCPIHGPIRKKIPSYYHTAVTGIQGTVNSAKSILDSLTCPRCRQVFSAQEVEDKKGIMEFKYRCPNGHREVRYAPTEADPSILKTVFKRLIHCDQCGLPCQILDTSIKGDKAKVEISCPAHGKTKKEMPAKHAWMLEKIAEALSEGTIARSMLNCTQCASKLSIRSLDLDKNKYKLKCGCPNGHSYDISQPTDLDEEAIDAIVEGVMKCNECDLVTEIAVTRVSGSNVDLELVCPIHGRQKKELTVDIYKYLESRESDLDRKSTIETTVKCSKCSAPITIRNSKIRDDTIELKVECRNGHGDQRYLSKASHEETLSEIYMRLYECHKCHNPTSLKQIQELAESADVYLVCAQHGESVVSVPLEHASAVRDAYLQTKSLRDLEVLMDSTLQTQHACEYQMDSKDDPSEILEIVKNVIEQHNVLFIDERTNTKAGLEAWYYGKALAGDEFVVVGSVSKENLAIRITVASNNETKLELMLGEMRENLREVLLRIKTSADDTVPKKISCPQCGAGLAKRALPGETVLCDHCGTPLHWG